MEFEKWTYSACGISESAATRGSNTITANNWPQFQHISNWRLLEAMAGSLTVLPSSSFWGPPQKNSGHNFLLLGFPAASPSGWKGRNWSTCSQWEVVLHTRSHSAHTHTHTHELKKRVTDHILAFFLCVRALRVQRERLPRLIMRFTSAVQRIIGSERGK